MIVLRPPECRMQSIDWKVSWTLRKGQSIGSIFSLTRIPESHHDQRRKCQESQESDELVYVPALRKIREGGQAQKRNMPIPTIVPQGFVNKQIPVNDYGERRKKIRDD